MSDLIVEPYTVDHYRALTGNEPDGAACLNLIGGPGFALRDGGEVLAIGGIRVQGIGQAWAMLSEAGKEHALRVVKTAKVVIEDSMTRERLYRVYAEATVDDPKWFKILGFHQQGNLFVR